MQLRMSPGGNTEYSRRKRPELPPSSVTATMATRSEMGLTCDLESAVAFPARGFVRNSTKSFSPRKTVERPVPPPRATMRTGRVRRLELRCWVRVMNWARAGRFAPHKLRQACEDHLAKRPAAVALRIEQFGEARIFLQESEVFVVARVVAILGPQLNRDAQILHGGIGLAGEAIEGRHRVNDVIGFRGGFVSAVEVLSCFVPAAEIHERHALRVVILGGFYRGHGRASGALVADADMHLGAVLQLFAGAFEGFLQRLFRAREFLLLKVFKALLVGFQLSQLGRTFRVGRCNRNLSLQGFLFHEFMRGRRLGGVAGAMLHVDAPAKMLTDNSKTA